MKASDTTTQFPLGNYYKSEFYNFYAAGDKRLSYMTFYRRLQLTALAHPLFFEMEPRKTFTVTRGRKIIRKPSAKPASFNKKILSRKQVELFIEMWGAPKGWN